MLTRYFYEDDEGNVKTIDGDEKAWEIGSCMKEYYGFANPPARQNLDFMIKLRNRIEHRFTPEIDPYVGGECQAMLFNFDELLTEEFGERFALQEYLCVPLHTSTRRPEYHLVPVANPGNLKSGKVVSLVEKRLGKKFNMYNHTQAWRYYGVRGSMNEPRACRTKFCQYDDAHKSHVYTPAWVEFLVFKLSDQQEYEKVVGFVHQGDK